MNSSIPLDQVMCLFQSKVIIKQTLYCYLYKKTYDDALS